jgi:hypothetical protein
MSLSTNPRMVTAVLHCCTGDVLFVPAGCAHQVENIGCDTSIAVSFNYVDESNIQLALTALATQVSTAAKASLISLSTDSLLRWHYVEDACCAMTHAGLALQHRTHVRDCNVVCGSVSSYMCSTSLSTNTIAMHSMLLSTTRFNVLSGADR